MRNLLLSLLFILLIVSCGKKSNVEIIGNIKEGAEAKVYLEQIDVDNKKIIDSTKLNKKGHFTFKLNTVYPAFYALKFSNNEQITLIASPDEKIEVSGTFNDLQSNYWVEGSENSLWIKLLNFQLDRTITLTDSLKKAYMALPKEKAYDAQREEYSKAWDEAITKQINFTHEFIIKHATSLAAYYALYQKINHDLFVLDEINDLHYFKIVASSLSALYPESQYTKAIMNHLKRIGQAMRNRQLAAAINNSEKSLPNISLPNAKGDTISLLPIKHKLVILEFGALTTQQSQAYIKDLKNIYQKFKNRGVEIYQVCLDKNKLLWEDVVKKNNIDWKCVWDQESLSSRMAAIWNVKNIPANYIINQDMEIVGKNLWGNRLEDRLNDLLKK